MPQHIAASDLRLTWPGAISTEMTDDRVMPWRIPYVERNLFAKELVEKAAMPAGVRIRFQSNTSSIEGFCNSFPERSQVDLLIDGGYVASAVTQNKTTFRFEDLGSATKTVELWLPQVGEFRFKGMNIDVSAELSEASTNASPKWITYGSSITHCSGADSPKTTWPAIVARTRGYDLTCLGFGGVRDSRVLAEDDGHRGDAISGAGTTRTSTYRFTRTRDSLVPGGSRGGLHIRDIQGDKRVVLGRSLKHHVDAQWVGHHGPCGGAGYSRFVVGKPGGGDGDGARFDDRGDLDVVLELDGYGVNRAG